MRILADHDVWAVTLKALRNVGHDVLTASDVGLALAVGTKLPERAHQDSRVIVVQDLCFGTNS